MRLSEALRVVEDYKEPAMPHERTMREALLEAGWSPTFLRSDLREARIGLKDDEVVFEPWSRLSRLQRPSNVVTRLLKLYPPFKSPLAIGAIA